MMKKAYYFRVWGFLQDFACNLEYITASVVRPSLLHLTSSPSVLHAAFWIKTKQKIPNT